MFSYSKVCYLTIPLLSQKPSFLGIQRYTKAKRSPYNGQAVFSTLWYRKSNAVFHPITPIIYTRTMPAADTILGPMR